MAKKKLTLSIEGDLLDEVKGIAAIRGKSLSDIVEEYLEYLVFERWAETLGKELDLGDLEPTTESEVSGSRPKGLDAAAALSELRSSNVRCRKRAE
jgi:metal-responsive CopG/Arc/MetJ family transcriptional regulator